MLTTKIAFFYLVVLFNCINAQDKENEYIFPLPYSKTEVENIINIVGGDLLLDENANLFKTIEAIEQYDVVHIATHTLVNEQLPLSSKFILNNKNHSQYELFLSQIYPLDIKAKMVVLSSCNTGRGKLEKGEGIISFARAFKAAGCPSIIMSLWEIDDIATSQIMKYFYSNLKTGKPKDISLRIAKLNYLSESNSKNAAPIFWASASAIGNLEPLAFKIKENIFSWTYAPLFFSLFAILFYFFSRKKRIT